MRAVAALALLALAGCGSVADLAEGPRIYGGVRKDVEGFDSPFSAVLDTARLPVTGVCETCRK